MLLAVGRPAGVACGLPLRLLLFVHAAVLRHTAVLSRRASHFGAASALRVLLPLLRLLVQERIAHPIFLEMAAANVCHRAVGPTLREIRVKVGMRGVVLIQHRRCASLRLFQAGRELSHRLG